jgi:hypothetical protein
MLSSMICHRVLSMLRFLLTAQLQKYDNQFLLIVA